MTLRATPRCATPRRATPRRATPRCATPRRVTRGRGAVAVTIFAVLLALALAPAASLAQRDLSQVEIQPTQVSGNRWMLEGAGGNIGVLAGPDGVMLVDDQIAELTEKIRAAVAKISDRPIAYVLNTHWHGDHTGGNANLRKAGSTIFAHDNVRHRMEHGLEMSIFGSRVPPSPLEALPVVTFNDSMTFHLNGETVTCFHVAPAHTDGDVAVWFRNAKVLHAGDVFFKGGYPVVDATAGGTLDGMVAAMEQMLRAIPDDVKIIPGHGGLATKADLVASRDMLIEVRRLVKSLVDAGKSLEDIQAAKPLAALEGRGGRASSSTTCS
jgi:glyoxylase-like metal-dependent hydrolase (beta-lactamase superfamily II)